MQKSQPAGAALAHIHSKPIVYTNDGGGRDTYVSQNDGGFRPLHRAGHGKRTYFNSLRQYPQQQHTSLFRSEHKSIADPRRDLFTNPAHQQEHYNPRYVREMGLLNNYQKMIDKRLSVPKAYDTVEVAANAHRSRVFRNSSPELQTKHMMQQSGAFSRTSANGFGI